jgi:hypothetical protein
VKSYLTSLAIANGNDYRCSIIILNVTCGKGELPAGWQPSRLA